MMVIVPNHLARTINEALNRAIEKCPGAERDRELLYQQLLDYFYEHGKLPEFTIRAPVAIEIEIETGATDDE